MSTFNTIEKTKFGCYYIASKQNEKTKVFTAWAKLTPIWAPNPILENGIDVWFEFGATREEAESKLIRSLYPDHFERGLLYGKRMAQDLAGEISKAWNPKL